MHAKYFISSLCKANWHETNGRGRDRGRSHKAKLSLAMGDPKSQRRQQGRRKRERARDGCQLSKLKEKNEIGREISLKCSYFM